MDYVTLKAIHFAAVVLSYSLFVIRGVWMIAQSPKLQQRWVRIAPHVVDTVLLVSAVALSISIRQYPFVNNWLTAKVIGLIVYIGLGTIALKRGRTRGLRIAAWLAAQIVFIYIVIVAMTHDPVPLSLN
jgi:uncharacterized membrane protein SirB2